MQDYDADNLLGLSPKEVMALSESSEAFFDMSRTLQHMAEIGSAYRKRLLREGFSEGMADNLAAHALVCIQQATIGAIPPSGPPPAPFAGGQCACGQEH